MYIKSHADLPALIALSKAMQEDSYKDAPLFAGVSLKLEDRAEIERPREWNRWHQEQAAKRRYERTEGLFADVHASLVLGEVSFAA